MGSQNWNAFKAGDRVIWRTALETGGAVACVAPPCDTSPGTVLSIASEKCGPGSRQKATVQHDRGDILTWDVAMLVPAPYTESRTAGGAPPNQGPAYPKFDDDWSMSTWLAIGCGTAVAMVGAAWWLRRLYEEEDHAPDSLFWRPRF